MRARRWLASSLSLCLLLAMSVACGDDDGRDTPDGSVPRDGATTSDGSMREDASTPIDGATPVPPPPPIDGATPLPPPPPPSSARCVRPPVSSGDPELPRVSVDITFVAPTGRTIDVPAGADLQAAIDMATPGDEIVLAAGATYAGNFTLREKSGDGWILIRSSRLAELPEGLRVHPSQAALMPVLETPVALAVVSTDPRAHHYRFAGIHFRPADGIDVNDLIVLGSGSTDDVTTQPHHLVVDRCLVTGDPVVGGKRGVQLNSGEAAIIDSWFADWKRESQDTQAILGWNGPGPYLIANNHLEGAGENVMFGGADSPITDLIPSDIEICGNHFIKPLEWKADDRSFEGTHWSIKNLFELKVGRRVLFAGNVLERSWTDAQTGFAIVLKSANQDGNQPWAITEHVTLAYNVILDANNGITISRTDGGSLGTQHIRLYSNVIHPMGADRWGGDGRALQILDGVVSIIVDHNTAFGRSQIVIFDGMPISQLSFTSNLFGPTTYGVFGSGAGEGTGALTTYAPDGLLVANVLVGADESAYPSGNYFPADAGEVGFVDVGAEDYALAGDSPYARVAVDGSAAGADFGMVMRATAGVRTAD